MKVISKESKEIIGYVIIGVCVLIICILIVSALALKGEEYDPESLCPDKTDAHTVIVLDKTDTFSKNQQRFILNFINQEKNKLETSEKFSIFTLTENTYMSPEPIFSKCNPGTGKTANKLYQNPRKMQSRFDSFFSKPLKENMNNMLLDNTGSKSPIFEMIRELSLRDDFSNDVGKRTLIIVSDMMHHTSKFSHYKNRSSYEYFSEKSYAYEVATSLNTVDVKIIYLLRDKLGYVQGPKHLSFWKDYFEDMGAEVATVRNVR